MIEKASHNDLEEMAKLHVSAWDETYSKILPSELLSTITVESRIKQWETSLSDLTYQTSIFIAKENGKIVGFAASGPQRDNKLAQYSGEFLAIYVLENHQKKGYGLLLMRAMCEDLLEKGFEHGALWVLKNNKNGRHFYDSLGGKIVDEKFLTFKEFSAQELAYAWDVSELSKKLDKIISTI